ncbi:phage/plasmid primase, P4 family [Tabrizicola piscis]|nr:phage/plasmid primase, P4 family [Tabrizicola piscis]
MNGPHHFDAPCLASALEYARRGWHVFPAPAGEKKSHTSAQFGNGERWGGTTDPTLIRNYWRQWPSANVGIACGPASGLLVIECDTPEGHAVDGIASMQKLIAAHGPLPDTIEALSPSGSWHLYFKYPASLEIGNSASLIAPGVDVRGEGGMVIGVPSVKPGKAEPYRWKNPPGLFELADCPDWLLQLCTKKKEKVADETGFHFDTGTSYSTTGTAEVEDLLSWIDPDAGGYYAWLDVLMGLHHHFRGSGEGLGLADDWSRQGAKYKPGEVAEKWAGFDANGKKTLSTVAAMARQNGADLSAIARKHRSSGAAGGGPGGQSETGSESAPPNDGTNGEIDLSHDALARDLGQRGWNRDAKFVAVQGRWYLWDGRRWAVDDCLRHMTLVRGFLQQRACELRAWADAKAEGLSEAESEKITAWATREGRSLRSANTVAAVSTLARSNPASVTLADAFDADLFLLGTPGGTVDLKTGMLRPARREDMISKLTAVTPAPVGTRAPTWLQFLDEVLDGDIETIEFLQRAAGYALTGLTTEHKLLFLYGTGRNGKSTFLEALQWLWGDYARRSAATTFLSSVGERHPTDVAGLAGARLVVGSELPKGKCWDEAVLKDLTGGDKMTARFMRGDFFDFVPQMTLMIAGNNMPSLRGVDEALRARMVLVPFTVTIPAEKRDPKLAEKLRAEGPAILRWAIEGALEWQRRGLAVPARVAAASTEYLDGEDLLGQFLADETVRAPGEFLYTTDLHQRFRQWAELQGLGSWTSHTLTKEMKSRGFQDSRRSAGRGFFDLRLARS